MMSFTENLFNFLRNSWSKCCFIVGNWTTILLPRKSTTVPTAPLNLMLKKGYKFEQWKTKRSNYTDMVLNSFSFDSRINENSIPEREQGWNHWERWLGLLFCINRILQDRQTFRRVESTNNHLYGPYTGLAIGRVASYTTALIGGVPIYQKLAYFLRQIRADYTNVHFIL